MDRMEKRLVSETKALIQQIERGETAHAAWTAVKDRVEMLTDGRTHRQVADLLGKKAGWVGKVLAWDADSTALPFARDAKLTKAIPKAEAKRALREVDQDEAESLLADLPIEQVRKIADAAERVHTQLHPATSIKPPRGLPPAPTFGFALEMGKPTVRLTDAIDLFVETWEKVSPEASEDERQVIRDSIAPKLLTLRATVEGVPVE